MITAQINTCSALQVSLPFAGRRSTKSQGSGTKDVSAPRRHPWEVTSLRLEKSVLGANHRGETGQLKTIPARKKGTDA